MLWHKEYCPHCGNYATKWHISRCLSKSEKEIYKQLKKNKKMGD